MNHSKPNALMGWSGFVGGHLSKRFAFEYKVNSSNKDLLRNKDLNFLIVSAARAEKWKANQNPTVDSEHIEEIIQQLKSVKAETAVLISTIDVYADPKEKDESSRPDLATHPYGKNRRELEIFFADYFKNSLIIRLPALFGEGIKKNIIFDLLNDNEVQKIDSRAKFQFYNLENIKKDIELALSNNIKILNLATAPASVAEISQYCFNKAFLNEVNSDFASYNMKSKHDHIWGRADGYLYSKNDILQDLKSFVENYRNASAK